MVTTLMVLLAALPPVSEPELLADLDQRLQPWRITKLAGATDDGLLVVAESAGASHLWWVPLDGRATKLGDTSDFGAQAIRLGPRLVATVQRTVSSISFEGQTVTNTPLAVSISEHPRFAQSSDPGKLFLYDGTTMWTTDGTVEGTTSIPRALRGPVIESGGRIGGKVNDTRFTIWNVSGTETSVDGVTSAAVKNGVFVLGGASLRNESGETLVAAPCETYAGAWSVCDALDGGRELFSTDGTPSGTMLRDAPGAFIFVFASDEGRIVYSVGPTFSGPARFISGAGDPATVDCYPMNGGPARFLGEVLLCARQLISLDGGAVLATTLQSFLGGASTRSGFVLHEGDSLVATNDTGVGTRPLTLDFGDTRPSYPARVSSNGETALFTTADAGTWLTDGTTAGTVLVGESALPWGKGALGVTAGAFAAFDSSGRPVPVPPGIAGVAHDWLVGRDGCTAFRVDEQVARESLDTAGKCVSAVHVFEVAEAAFLEVAGGELWLVRSPSSPVPLGTDVDPSVAPRCGAKRCWYAATGDGFRIRSVNLETREITEEDSGIGDSVVTLLAASDEACVASIVSANTEFHIKRRGKPAFRFALKSPNEPTFVEPTFGIAANSDVFVADGDHVSVVGESAIAPQLFRCYRGHVQVSGNRFWATCDDDGSFATFRLLAGETGAPSELRTGLVAVSDIGVDGELEWFSTRTPGGREELVLRRGAEEQVVAPLYGSGFAPVRAGVVFAADELMVVRYDKPAKTCGCSTGSALAPLLFVGWWLRRRRACELRLA